MISVEEARVTVIAGVSPGRDAETVALASANRRFLAEEIRALVANPVFDNSAMDGYAVRVADVAVGRSRLPVAGESRCGDVPTTLADGSAMRIFTGAPLPAGADAVAIQEDVTREGEDVLFRASAQKGENIRYQGEDFRADELLYPPGTRLRSFDIALIGTAGIAAVKVWCPARALVLATGSELVTPPSPLRPGQIYESNRLATLLQLQDLGVSVEDGGIVPDDVNALRQVLTSASDYDFVITSGGASVGDHDLVKQVFSEIGEINFWKVKVKPGKPLAFGRIGKRTHFFALPGNPVSSLVTFKLFVEPAILAWHHAPARYLELKAQAINGFRRSPGRTEFLRGHAQVRQGKLFIQVSRAQGSHMVGAMRDTNALVRLEAEESGFDEGAEVTIIPLTID
jgi:molybdopterin molybdotransferase